MNTAKLIAEWFHNGNSYRVIAKADWSPGWEDVYVVEKNDTDALGGCKWVEVDRWSTKGITGMGDLRTILVSGIKAQK